MSFCHFSSPPFASRRELGLIGLIITLDTREAATKLPGW